ncbi:hypothetical protein Hanom_Chr11g01060671 [Helianthus anomalus]
MVGERLGVSCNPNSTSTLSIIFCGIWVNGEYGWRWFVLDMSRCFIDYSIAVPSGGWRTGFSRIWESQGLNHNARCNCDLFLAV